MYINAPRCHIGMERSFQRISVCPVHVPFRHARHAQPHRRLVHRRRDARNRFCFGHAAPVFHRPKLSVNIQVLGVNKPLCTAATTPEIDSVLGTPRQSFTGRNCECEHSCVRCEQASVNS